ncbi:hypothetical protein N8758_00180 [Crocinitomicaceae bacterium]|nr:hypothetical protein [Crocinitomicaceae bacterium]
MPKRRMIFYSVVLFLGILSATRYAKSLQLTNLNNWHMPTAQASSTILNK